jgi:hypothetical protein
MTCPNAMGCKEWSISCPCPADCPCSCNTPKIRCGACKEELKPEIVDRGPPIFRHVCKALMEMAPAVVTLGTHGKLERRVAVLEKALEISCTALAGHSYGTSGREFTGKLMQTYIQLAEKEIP